MHVSALHLYPVKSLRGFAVPAVEIDELGFAGDRRFLVIDEAGKFQTQRQIARMALVSTTLANGILTLSAAGAGSIRVQTASDPTARLHPVAVWKSEGMQAEDCGPAAAAWLSNFLQLKCRLVRIGEKFSRPVLKSAARPGDLFTFADGAPFLIVSEASVVHLNARIQENHGEPVPINRFRPNIVVNGCEAFAEDGWSRFRIGDVVFRNAGTSQRCIITTTDQFTGARGKEPLKTLATFRRDPASRSEVIFGINVIHETKRGTVRVGDQVELL